MSLPILAEDRSFLLRGKWTKKQKKVEKKMRENDTSRTSKSCWRIIEAHTHTICCSIAHGVVRVSLFSYIFPSSNSRSQKRTYWWHRCIVHINSIIIIITIYRFNHFDPIFLLRFYKRASRICSV